MFCHSRMFVPVSQETNPPTGVIRRLADRESSNLILIPERIPNQVSRKTDLPTGMIGNDTLLDLHKRI